MDEGPHRTGLFGTGRDWTDALTGIDRGFLDRFAPVSLDQKDEPGSHEPDNVVRLSDRRW